MFPGAACGGDGPLMDGLRGGLLIPSRILLQVTVLIEFRI